MDEPPTTETIRCTSATGFDPVVTALLVLGLMHTPLVAITALRDAGATAPTKSAPAALASVDPNTAPWWELMVLPDIGEITARKIVEYRHGGARRKPMFHQPADLESVPGIGPKTVQRISPFLRFGDQ